MDKDSVEREVGLFRASLEDAGFHPRSTDAYGRALSGFLSGATTFDPDDEASSREAVEGYLARREPAYDGHTVAAALRRWHLFRHGVRLSKRRDLVSDYMLGPGVESEVAAFRLRLEQDGLVEDVIDSYCSSAAMFLGWLFGGREPDISEVGPFEIVDYLADRKQHLNGGGLKTEATRLKRYCAFVDDRLGREPASIPVNPPSWGSRPLPRKLGEGEFLALTTPDGSARSVVVAVAACLMGNLGLRCCEASALTLDDIDFANATVSVAATKGNYDRRLPLDRMTGELLALYITGFRPPSASRKLFIRSKSHRGDPMSKSQLRGLMRYQARLDGIGDFGTHMLRRRSASAMVESGVPVKVVADIMGHASIQTTKEYLRIDVAKLRAAAGKWPGGKDE